MNEGKKSLLDSKKIVGSAQTKNEQKKELVILKGITTSQINQALKAKNPYPARAFLKTDNQEQDIPVFFRKREIILCPTHKKYFSDLGWRNCCPWYCHGNLGDWVRPKIPAGSLIEVKGYFDNPKNGSQRPSFTATSFQLLTSNHSQVEYLKNE